MEQLDIAIIGGGPAGLAAGLYASRGGAACCLFEELFPGGQAAKTQQIDNYPGFADGVEGMALGAELERHATRFGLTIEYAGVSAFDLAAEPKRIMLDHRTVLARTVILCMGATPRKLGIPREAELTGAGVSYCATCDGAFFKGRDVAVVGGGDTAIADALYLARFASKVYVIHRRDRLRASAALAKAAMEESRIAFVWDSVTVSLEGEKSVTGITVRNVKTDAQTQLPVAGVFVAVGIEPRTELVKGQLMLDPGGAIETNGRMETSLPGVFAAGDVRNTPLRQVITACADGALAATAALEYISRAGKTLLRADVCGRKAGVRATTKSLCNPEYPCMGAGFTLPDGIRKQDRKGSSKGMARLFGTDGVRGIANGDLDCNLAFDIGAYGANVLVNEVHSPRILVGRDTRKSGAMLGAALSAGICSVGGDVLDVGVLPTPAMAHLVRLYEADAAVMISASHNTMEYNGIKWFDGNGFKLPDEVEDRIEAAIRAGEALPHPTGRGVGDVIPVPRAAQDYKDHLVRMSAGRFEGLKVVLDCANGATSFIARDVFERLGATVIATACAPDGININDDCGSTHPERLQETVVATGADIGFAFDGDADRLISSDEYGNIVDGDQAMGILALHMKQKGTLHNDTLVITVMSNLGLKQSMRQAGVSIAETKVGDRYVLECMRENGHSIGGEQSGHIILLDKNTTGDGMMSAIALLNVVAETKRPLSALAANIPQYPQVLVNVTVANGDKAAAMEDGTLLQKKREVEAALGENGRVLLRASGTEPLVRIMLEGTDEKEILDYALSMAHIIVDKYNGKIRA